MNYIEEGVISSTTLLQIYRHHTKPNGNVQIYNFSFHNLHSVTELWSSVTSRRRGIGTERKGDKKALLSQRWPRDAPYVYLQAIHPNFVHAYGHYTMRGFW